jgi:hypothetical protein
MHRLRFLLGLAAAAVLTGCTLTVPLPTDEVTAGIDPDAVVRTQFLEPGERLVLRVFNSTLRDLLVADVVGVNVRVTLMNEWYGTLAVSEQREFFARSVAGLAGADAAAATPASVIPSAFCRGPCVAIVPEAGTRYLLEITNRAATRQPVSLYLYGIAAVDPRDRGGATNDTLANAFPVSVGDVGGAIEVIGDADWFRFVGTDDATLTFYPFDEVVGLRLQFDGQMQLISGPSVTAIIRPGDRFRVFSAFNRAGPSGTSGYAITIERD